nr:Qat anti-phage system associated protein QatB [uncultured Dongia sp.]
MGTSTPFSGGTNSNPLLPSWLQTGDNEPMDGDSGAGDSNGNPGDSNSGDGYSPSPDQDGTPPPQVPTSNFKPGRTDFNKLARSGGGDNARLAKSVGHYIAHAAGGSKMAARRMASDRNATFRLASFLGSAAQTSVREVLQLVNLGHLADRPIREIYLELVDLVCEPGGDLDESYTRDAYLEAIGEVLSEGEDGLEKPSAEKIAEILEAFATKTISNRILNAIGNQVIVLPEEVTLSRSIEKQLSQFIHGAVSDAFAKLGPNLHPQVTQQIVDDLYERSLFILQTMADAQAED